MKRFLFLLALMLPLALASLAIAMPDEDAPVSVCSSDEASITGTEVGQPLLLGGVEAVSTDEVATTGDRIASTNEDSPAWFRIGHPAAAGALRGWYEQPKSQSGLHEAASDDWTANAPMNVDLGRHQVAIALGGVVSHWRIRRRPTGPRTAKVTGPIRSNQPPASLRTPGGWRFSP